MGRKETKSKKEAAPKTSKNIRKPLRDLYPCANNQFNEKDPIGLARIFWLQKQMAMALFVKPKKEIQFREKEAQAIDNFVEEFMAQKARGCRFLMVAGHPGLGKSTCVDSVLQKRGVRVIAIEAENSLREVQCRIAQEILGVNFDSDTQQLLCRLTLAKIAEPIIVRVKGFGELLRANLDYYSQEFLSLFSMKEVNLGLIGVGGSMEDLDKYVRKAQMLQKSFRSVPFAPYGKEAIASIIREKVQAISDHFYLKIKMSEQAMQVAVRKLLALTNDVRVMLANLQAIILGKLECFERTLPVYPEDDDYERWVFSIEPEDLEAIKKVEISKAALASSLPAAQQVILLAIHRTLTAEDLLYLSDEQTLQEAKDYLAKANIPSSYEQIKSWLREIENYGLIKMDRKGPKTRIMLMVDTEDLKWCLQAEPDSLRSLQLNTEEMMESVDNLC